MLVPNKVKAISITVGKTRTIDHPKYSKIFPRFEGILKFYRTFAPVINRYNTFNIVPLSQ